VGYVADCGLRKKAELQIPPNESLQQMVLDLQQTMLDL
jgi:hypothetical protein